MRSGWQLASKAGQERFSVQTPSISAVRRLRDQRAWIGNFSGISGMGTKSDHRDLLVWRKSIALAGKVYAATRLQPSEEHSGLKQQLRRAAVCIASSIAEGSTRGNRTEFIQFLRMAHGSLSAIETQVLIAAELGLIGQHQPLLNDIVEIGHLLNALIRTTNSAARTAHANACSCDSSSVNR